MSSNLLHPNLGDENLHVAAWVRATDPAADSTLPVSAGKMWVDTSSGPPYVLKVRNAANDGWETAGSGGAARQPASFPRGVLSRSYDGSDATGWTGGSPSSDGTTLSVSGQSIEPSSADEIADGEIEFDLIVTRGSGDTSIPIYFRCASDGSYYELEITNSGATLRWFDSTETQNSEVTRSFDWAPPYVDFYDNAGWVSPALVRFEGSKVSLFIEDSLMAIWSDDYNLGVGLVGVGAGDPSPQPWQTINIYEL